MTPELAQLKIKASQMTRPRGHRMRWHTSRFGEFIYIGKCYRCKRSAIITQEEGAISGSATTHDCIEETDG